MAGEVNFNNDRIYVRSLLATFRKSVGLNSLGLPAFLFMDHEPLLWIT